MEKPLGTLIVKAASAIACFGLIVGIFLIVASRMGMVESKLPGDLSVMFGGLIAIFTLGAANFDASRRLSVEKHLLAALNGLAQGRLVESDAKGDLMEEAKSISDYLEAKATLADRVTSGDLFQGTAPLSEFDFLGRSMLKMVESLRQKEYSQESREKLYNSIAKLLERVSEVSAGDLTVQVDADPELTGAIGEAFKLLTHNLRTLVKQVKDITFQVGLSADSINETTEQLTQENSIQSSQITRAAAAIANLALKIQDVSEIGERSAGVAAETLSRARSGTRSAADNINAMKCIRRQVMETSKRVKRLGERSQEIGQIVTLIDDLSDRTSLLALNASLQASTTSSSGNGFSAVAEEVERLAERSNRLTGQIGTLTQTINAETKEVVAAMEATIREVVVGSALADKAGRSLFGIEQVSANLVDLLDSIAESSKFQAESSEEISNSMSSIADVTGLVSSASNRAAELARSLVQLSDELRTSISPFKLPDDMSTTPDTEKHIFVN